MQLNKQDKKRVEILEFIIEGVYKNFYQEKQDGWEYTDTDILESLDVITKCEAQIAAIKSRYVQTVDKPELPQQNIDLTTTAQILANQFLQEYFR